MDRPPGSRAVAVRGGDGGSRGKEAVSHGWREEHREGGNWSRVTADTAAQCWKTLESATAVGNIEVDNWDDEEEEEEVKETEVKQEPKVSEKKKIAEKIKEKEKLLKKKQEELKKRLEAPEEHKELTPEEQLADKLRLKKLQEESDLELAKETFGVNNTCGIDAMNPSSKDDFTEFGKLLKEKITQYEKSLHYASFLEALVRDVCISLEVDDLKKITNTLTVLCSEKQKQEKNKAKKKKKGVVPGGGLKATMKDDLADYGGYDGEYVQDFEDFM
ncbi:PREDICTED: eukaryotic translation initiation factor 3 subunit J [Tauraco erythrolophus]|uniref:eukaryotic translation initiation factor 3 subunit J n=1 Tax=Tauraco erythrolophus TaxID=121530 RepID=UPI000523E557|nr:PREDICTED: eukaryotic translation initiation factor 3 subunit J [Tauraco erythrolophus]